MSDCALCGEPNATYPAVTGGFLCEDPVECLMRVNTGIEFDWENQEEEYNDPNGDY